MNKKIIFPTLLLLLFTSCQSKLEKFNSEYENFKTENSEVLKKSFSNFMSFENLKTDDSLINTTNKKIELNLDKKDFNALVVDQSYFEQLNGNENTPDLFNPLEKDNLTYLKRMINGAEDKMYFIESIREQGFDFDEYSGPMSQYEDYISFCERLPKTKYILINKANNIILPQLNYNGFYKGEYSSTIVLYDFNTKKVLSSFNLSAFNSDAIYESSTSSSDYRTLYNDLNEQIELSLKEKLHNLYTISSYDLEGIEFVEYIESE